MNVIWLVFVLIALLMVVTAFFPNWNFAAGPVVTPNRIVGLLIGLVVLFIVLFIVYLIVQALFGGVTVRPAAAAPLGLLALGVVNPQPDPGPIPPVVASTPTPPITTTSGLGAPITPGLVIDWHLIGYIVAAILFLVNVAIGAIQAMYASGHGADLGITPQFQAWLAVVSTVVAAAMGLLPQLTRTPAARLKSYLKAYAGELPKDIAAKYNGGSRAA